MKQSANKEWIKQEIRATQGLNENEKHNALVQINEAEWNESKPKQIYSWIVLIIIMFGSIANNLELNLINTAFQYPEKTDYYYIGHLFGPDL